MGSVRDWLGGGLLLAGALLLIAVGLPLLAVLILVLRPFLVVVAVVGLATVLVLAICSQRFREWFATVGEEQIHYKGLRFATEIAIHPCHSWARIKGQRAEIGVDDLVQFTLGPVEEITLPRVGMWCHRGAALFTLRRGDRVLQVRSPVSGKVEAINSALLDLPDLINQTPFTDGWAVRVRADRMRQECEALLQGKQARDWFRCEIDRLIGGLSSSEAIGPALPDGGELAGDLYSRISDREWRTLTQDFFGAPPVMIQSARVAPSHPL